jgi:hypothetical protein
MNHPLTKRLLATFFIAEYLNDAESYYGGGSRK